MSGLAPIAVYLSAFLVVALGLFWMMAKVLRWKGAEAISIVFAAVTVICFGYLAIEKFVGVHYTRGLYMAIALMLVVGFGMGLALRRSR